MEAFLYQGQPLPQNSVMIQFDDGYYSNYVYAYPILREFGLRAVIFPITARTEMHGEFQPPLDYEGLTPAAAITVRGFNDVFESASHTHDLHGEVAGTAQRILTTKTREEIITDMQQSFTFVSNHRTFAYPGGQYNDVVIDALRETGITMAFNTYRGYASNTSNPFLIPRFGIYRNTTLQQFINIVTGRG
jgi:peptidoglycan/xylan/chitin deacetylase (PgdA/CDA1 family)